MRRYLRPTLLALVLANSAAGCTRNAATGKLVFNTMNEREELAFGQEISDELEDAVAEYRHAELNAYVSDIGHKMAAVSERPDLDWEFKVLDSWIPNAFAIAGGHVYVTRGLLAIISTEAELASVLAHEVGHVAALHSAQTVSRQRARNGRIFGIRGKLTRSFAERREFAFSREQEHEADALGVRYLERAGYDPRAAAESIASLEAYGEPLRSRVERERLLRMTDKERAAYQKAQKASDEELASLPAWKKTHPDSSERIKRLRASASGKKGAAKRAEYLEAIDGIIYGQDPREGFFLGNRLVHPAAGITMDVPEGWKAVSNGEVLIAIEDLPEAPPGKDDEGGMMIMFATEHETIPQAYEEFFEEIPFKKGERWERDLGDSRSIAVGIGGEVYPENLVGFAGFSKMQGIVFGVVAFSPSSRWRKIGAAAFASFSSLRILREPALLNTQPVRLRVQHYDQPVPLAQLGAASDGAITSDESAVLNHVRDGDQVPAGPVKVVVGNWPDLPPQPPR